MSKANYDYLHKINNCNIVGGVLYLFPHSVMVWLLVHLLDKQAVKTKYRSLLKFWLEQTKDILMFFLLVV